MEQITGKIEENLILIKLINLRKIINSRENMTQNFETIKSEFIFDIN